MEKGTLRADVNVSVRKRGEDGFRPRWELKNMNSFTFIRRGIEAAVREQVAAYERGETLEQSTYDYDPDTDRLTVHRSKEEADDYRYFPEPDLVPVEPPAELVERLRAELRRAARRRASGRIEAEVGFDLAYELVTTGNEPKADALVEHGRRLGDGRERRDEPAGLPARRTPPALAKIVEANVTREALNAAFAAAATGSIDGGGLPRRRPRSATSRRSSR